MRPITLFTMLTLLSLTTATQAQATHCPGCDTSEPTYGSSAWDRRYDAGKYQEGNGQYPRERERSSVDRYNDQQRQQERNREDQRRDNSQHNRRGEGGGYTCKGLYGC